MKQPPPAGSSPTGAKPQQKQASQPGRQQVARTAALPELKRVIVGLGNRVVMAEKLDEALRRVVQIEAALGKQEPAVKPATGEPSDLGVRALNHYNRAKDYLRQGDWAGYGRELEQLENILKQLSETAADRQ
jgi:uncharacterized membrane protein (UPF0182 family)